MPASSDLPDIAKLKISELREELDLYCIDTSGFSEKSDFTSALKTARETLPRPITTYREPIIVGSSSSSEGGGVGGGGGGGAKDATAGRKKKSSSSTTTTTNVVPPRAQAQAPTSTSTTRSASPTPPPSSRIDPSSSSSSSSSSSFRHHKDKDASSGNSGGKKALASRTPVTARQTLREHPSSRVLGERNNTYLPGSPFSFSLKGSLHEDDSAIIRVPDGVCLTINAASVDRESISAYLLQRGSIGVSLKISSEENPELLPLWTFDGSKSKSYTISDLGIRICGPRNIRLFAYMEMGLRSSASVDVYVFGSVSLDGDKF